MTCNNNVSWFVQLAADLRVDEQDSRKTIELGESHSKVDDGHEDYKSEAHYVDMQENINDQGIHYNVDGAGEVNPIVTKHMWMMPSK